MSWVEGPFRAFWMLALESDFHNATTRFFKPKSMTMASARVIRGECSPNGGLQWLPMKPWMCSIGRCTRHCIAWSAWPSKWLAKEVHFFCRWFVVMNNWSEPIILWSIKNKAKLYYCLLRCIYLCWNPWRSIFQEVPITMHTRWAFSPDSLPKSS